MESVVLVCNAWNSKNLVWQQEEVHWEKTEGKKSHTFQIKKIDLISLFTYFQLQSLKALLAETIILLKLKTFFEISKPYCFTLMGERSTKSTASTTSSMKGKNRNQIELKVTLPLGPLIVLRHAIARKEMQCVTTNFWGLALEHSLKKERPRLIFWFFFFIRLADQLIIALNSVSCALKGLSFVHLLRNLLNTFAIVCYWFVTPEPGAL